jgi:hypothetical protein
MKRVPVFVWLLFAAVLSTALLVSCSHFERQGVVTDAGSYVGATAYPDGTLDRTEAGLPLYDGEPDYDPTEIALRAATEAAKHAGDPVGLALWAAGGGIALAVGWAKRRFLARAIVDAGAAIGRGVVGSKKKEEDEEEKE